MEYVFNANHKIEIFIRVRGFNIEHNVSVRNLMICMNFYQFKDSSIFYNITNINLKSLIRIYIYTINIISNILSKFDTD